MKCMGSDTKITATIKKVMPAVVSIAIAKHLEDLEKEIPKDLYPFLPGGPDGQKLKIPDNLIDKRGMVEIGGGSGFVVDPNGIILTNKHVISDTNAEYTVIMNSGLRFPAQILSRDPINDVAILKINAVKLPFVKLGDATKLELGESVIAIGNALGIFKNTVSLGIVSGLSRSISAQADPNAPPQEMRGLIQTDAAINPGNSGGPLVDLNGLAIGVNAAIVFGAQNIGFAIPANAARRDLDDIKKYGRIRRPLLGLRYMMVDENMKDKMGLPVSYGAFVIGEGQNDPGVIPGSPAEKAGLREKDLVLEFNSKRLDREHPIQDFLETMNVGEDVELLVMREGNKFKSTMTLAERK
ncbi:MAG: trypsin-like peptidase domain-containing protein [Candidatus Liptonbacteria bacterium]|nr:trypsin-like peptidase domain-containing protein [Candidatus Liptonbacteria bacterium]